MRHITPTFLLAFAACSSLDREAATAVALSTITALEMLIFAGIGTFIGAFAAFRLEQRQRRQEKADAERGNGNRVLSALTNQYSLLRRIDEQWLREHREDPLRWLALKPFDGFGSFLRIDPSNLDFLLESPVPNLTVEVLLAEEAFLTLTSLMARRNDLHLNTVQPATEPLGRGHIIRDNLELDRLLGPQTVTLLKDLTDSIYEIAAEASNLNDAAYTALRTHLIQRYPGMRIISREYVPPVGRNQIDHAPTPENE